MNAKLEHGLRLYSGLFIAFFLVLHLLNAGLGILSLSAMDYLGEILIAFWSFFPLTILLYSAFLLHIGLMFVSLFRRRSLRMPAWNLLQFAMALIMPILLIAHVAGTRGVYELMDVHRNYTGVVTSLWGSMQGVVKQYILMIVAWTHMSIGIHYWLRHRQGYCRWIPVLYPLCLVIPLLAGLGFLRAGLESLQLPADTPALLKIQDAISVADPAARQILRNLELSLLWLFALLLAAVLIRRSVRTLADRRHGGFIVSHTPSGKLLSGRRNQTVLDTLREANIQHAAVCGGRGRCTTCRVRVSKNKTPLPRPDELESRALQRVGAGPDVRLACQLRPNHDLTITPLLQPDAKADAARTPAGVMGHEQAITCMFVDLRDSTRLGEQKLPYDVVFILNQFFIQLDSALHVTNGHYATFNGDGLMALYGLDSDLSAGCRSALAGAVEIQRRMEELNVWLAAELNFPLRVGIGIHCGDAIVGAMGPPAAPMISALGDIVNVTARLESLTKEYGTGLIVSEDVLDCAGINKAGLPRHSVQVRGRDESLTIFVVDNPAALTDSSAELHPGENREQEMLE